MRKATLCRQFCWVALLSAGALGSVGCGRTSVGQGGTEICDNGVDDDGDGLVDCADPDCTLDPYCRKIKPGQERCDNGVDDDGDGLVDCKDRDCTGDPVCTGARENCANGIDDDGDGLVDCADKEDCRNAEVCRRPGVEICDNGLDDDGDGLADCKDLQDCQNDPACAKGKEDCTNKVDDDGDGLVDCDDTDDCASAPACQAKVEICSNKVDDDGDGKIDCRDPDCYKHPDCKTLGQEICNNGIDDDEDGLVDCKDPDCSNLPMCIKGKEVCNNHIDDDKDGATDCDDPDCALDPGCLTEACKPTVDFGTLQGKGSRVTKTLTTTGQKDVYRTNCAVPGGGEVVASFQLAVDADVRLTYTQNSGDHVFSLHRAGIGEACNANTIQCLDPDSQKTGSFNFTNLKKGAYYLMAEAYAKSIEGSVSITLSTGVTTSPENCQNGIDDDGDLAVDCADLDCALDPACKSLVCKYDENVGTLVVNGPGKRVTFNTKTAPNVYDLTCSGGGGGERVVRFAMPTSAVLGASIEQQGWHSFGVYADKGPGTICISDSEGHCTQNKWPQVVIEHGTLPKGVYSYIVDAMNANSGGPVALTLRAYQNRGPELCNNGIDDDGDGLADCLDPDCAGTVGCPGAICVPNYRTGPLGVGAPPVSFSIDTTKQNNDQTVPCALGGGKDAVIEVDLPDVTALRVQCTQTGDHVIGLFEQGKPRDPCDKTSLSCADPKVGPIACNYYWGNMQPGKYYVIVEAFKPGSEGQVNISLQATPDTVQEICNNGIDDDGDGKIDCQDYNCSSLPICQGKTCTPEQKLGVLAKGGAAVNVAATTQGAGDQQATSCAAGGGEDYAFSFKLVTKSDLTISFAQFGNHVVGLFQNKGPGYACDAAPLGCQTTNNQPFGKMRFQGLDPGEYYVVVEAVKAGSEGSVVLQVQAQ